MLAEQAAVAIRLGSDCGQKEPGMAGGSHSQAAEEKGGSRGQSEGKRR